jgi:hypothetical protein
MLSQYLCKRTVEWHPPLGSTCFDVPRSAIHPRLANGDPRALPIDRSPLQTVVPRPATDEELAGWLGRLEYPGFAYLKTRTARKNPYEVLLLALGRSNLDGRVAEALAWVAMKYARPDSWLVETARKYNLQNRLGFVVKLARHVAERHEDEASSNELRQLEAMLEESRLAGESYFYRAPRNDKEREWLLQTRTGDAAHWNLLTDMRPEELPYAG